MSICGFIISDQETQQLTASENINTETVHLSIHLLPIIQRSLVKRQTVSAEALRLPWAHSPPPRHSQASPEAEPEHASASSMSWVFLNVSFWRTEPPSHGQEASQTDA